MADIATVDQLDARGKRVLVRVDFNVPVADGVCSDDTRIRAALPTIEKLIDEGARVILMSHLGRPSGEGFEEKFTLRPAALRLSELLGMPVALAADVVGPDGKRIAVVDALSGIRIIPEKLKIAPVWVVEEAVKKDRDGYFVWRIRDLKERYPENAIPEIMHLEKVRVVPQGLIMQYGNNFLRGLKTDAGLRRTDILVGDVPAGVNPGDRVVYHRKRHRFQIGEKVTAVFSGGYDDHVFLVPDRVLAKNGTDSGYHVFLRDGDRARAVPVAKLGKTEGKIRIYSTELKAGAELLMPSAGEKIGNGDRIAVGH